MWCTSSQINYCAISSVGQLTEGNTVRSKHINVQLLQSTRVGWRIQGTKRKCNSIQNQSYVPFTDLLSWLIRQQNESPSNFKSLLIPYHMLHDTSFFKQKVETLLANTSICRKLKHHPRMQPTCDARGLPACGLPSSIHSSLLYESKVRLDRWIVYSVRQNMY